MNKITIAFDVDGTLRDNKEDYEQGNPIGAQPNERIRTLLITLASFKNTQIIVWSGGGREYAEDIVRAFKLEPYVDKCLSKESGFVPDIAIDDIYECNLGQFSLIVREK